MVGSPIVTLRLSPSLKAWFDEYTRSVGLRPTDVLRDLLEGVRDRRVVIMSEPAGFVIINGSTPDLPVLICHNPK